MPCSINKAWDIYKRLRLQKSSRKVIVTSGHSSGRKQFANPLRFLLDEVFDEVHTLDFTGITKQDKRFRGNSHQYTEFSRRINKNHISAVINLSFSKLLVMFIN